MILKNKLFIFSIVLFVLNQLLEKQFEIYVPLLHTYLDDLLCMPVVLTLSLYILQLLLKNEQFRLTKFQVIIAVVYFAVMFELILPAFSIKYTSDVLDIAVYGIGAFIFFKFINILPLQTQIP